MQWLPNNTVSITQANATLESQASGGSAPDLVWEQYGPVTSGALPAGLLQNIKPFLEKPNPYVPGNSSWPSLFTAAARPRSPRPGSPAPRRRGPVSPPAASPVWDSGRERWDGWSAERGFQSPKMNSFNHYSLGAVGEWVYRLLLGIDQQPGTAGFDSLLMRPHVDPGGSLS